MVTMSVEEAQKNFSGVLNLVTAGEDVVLYQEGQPVVRMTALPTRSGQRSPGTAKGKITIAPNFDAPLSEDELREFES